MSLFKHFAILYLFGNMQRDLSQLFPLIPSWRKRSWNHTYTTIYHINGASMQKSGMNKVGLCLWSEHIASHAQRAQGAFSSIAYQVSSMFHRVGQGHRPGRKYSYRTDPQCVDCLVVFSQASGKRQQR